MLKWDKRHRKKGGHIDNRIHFRPDAVTDDALNKAHEKWPLLNRSELARKVIEQWSQLQDAGTSKTQKLVEIQRDTTNILYQMAEMRKGIQELSDRLAALEDRLEQHDF